MAAYWQLSRDVPIGRFVSRDSEVEVHLRPDQVLTLSGDRRGWSVVCEAGTLWITQDGDPKDHAIGPGEQFRVSRSGVVVIQGVPSGDVRIVH